jgi:arsenate reductase
VRLLREINTGDAAFPALLVALNSAHLPTDDLADNNARYFTLNDQGFGGLAHLGEAAMLRSVVSATRGRGDGKALVELLLQRAQEHGHREIWLLTTTAAGFFEKLGFKRMPREAAPAHVRDTRQFSGLCPDTAVLMCRSLP